MIECARNKDYLYSLCFRINFCVQKLIFYQSACFLYCLVINFYFFITTIFTTIKRQSMQILGEDGLSPLNFIKFLVIYALPLNVVTVAANYLFYRSLKTLNPSTVASIFSSQSAFVYILSIIFLGEKFFFIRVRVFL